MDCSLPGSSTHGIFQARVLKWGAIAFSLAAVAAAEKAEQPEKPWKWSSPAFLGFGSSIAPPTHPSLCILITFTTSLGKSDFHRR